MCGLDLTQIQRMTGCETLRQGNHMCVHGTQDSDMKDLVRAPPNIKFAWREALRRSELQMSVRSLVSRSR